MPSSNGTAPEEKDKRLPQQFGDFAESLVMYIFGEYKQMRVALVDHIGADIIASKKDSASGAALRYAISVKGHQFGKTENMGFPFGTHDIEMLRDFAESFALVPVVAFVFVDAMEEEQKIRLLAARLDSLERLAADQNCEYMVVRRGGGVHINYGITSRHNYLAQIRDNGSFDYTELTFTELERILNL